MMTSIEVHNLTHCYNSHPAVDDISFQLGAGHILGLLGPNGAGKSTTIKMLITLLPPTSGTATVMGYDIVREPHLVRAQIGYVPQLISADGDLTGYENLLLSAKLYGLSQPKRGRRIEEVLSFMELDPYAGQLVNQYSGGMIRRLEIAQALLHEPKVLFLDEPTVGLDLVSKKSLLDRIRTWRKKFGTTILITTHDMDEADALCDQVAFMNLGKIAAMDTPANLKAALGPNATLEDAFIHFTSALLNVGGDYDTVKQTRHTISHLD